MNRGYLSEVITMQFHHICSIVLLMGALSVHATDAEVQSAQKAYDASINRAKQDYESKIVAAQNILDARTKEASRALIVVLQRQVGEATKAGDLGRATTYQTLVKKLEAGGTLKGLRPPLPKGKKLEATLLASGDDEATIYINGQLLTKTNQIIKPMQVRLGVGDVITIKAANKDYHYGFACIFIFQKEKMQITSSTDTWVSYTPRTLTKWYDPAEITATQPAVAGGAHDTNQQMAKFLTGDIPCIWGPVPREKDNVCYLSTTITDEMFTELQIAPPEKQ